MKKRVKALIVYILVIMLLPLNNLSLAYPHAEEDYILPLVDASDNYEDGEVIVSFKDNVKESKANKVIESVDKDAVITDSISLKDGNAYIVSSDDLSTNELIKKMSESNKVAYVEPNLTLTFDSLSKDTYSDYQWYLKDNIYTGSDIGYKNYGSYRSVTSDTPIVAVCDTGVRADHEDLRDALYTDMQYDTHSKSLVDADDNFGHGTKIAGIIAATANNNRGIAGIADAKILPVCVVDSETGHSSTSDLLTGIQYILEQKNKGANICAINISLSGTIDSNYDAQMSALNSIIALAGEKGILTVCSSGNEGIDIDKTHCFPGGFDNPYIINVGASSRENKPALFSNYGQEAVDVFAPGTDIFTTIHGYAYVPEISHKTFYCPFNNLKEGSGANTLQDPTASANPASANASSNSTLRIYANAAESSIHLDKTMFFSNTKDDTTSLRWDLKAKDGKNYYISIPVTIDKNLRSDYSIGARVRIIDKDNPNGTESVRSQFISYLYTRPTLSRSVGSNDDKYCINSFGDEADSYLTTNDDCWSTHVMSINPNNLDTLTPGVYYMIFRMYNAPASNYSIYIDNIGIGEHNVEYIAGSGTSYAAPIVAAEAALIKGRMPSLNAREIRARILGGVDVSSAYSGKCSSGGKINIDKAMGNNLLPSLRAITIKDNNIVIKGDNFKTAAGNVIVKGNSTSPTTRITSWKDDEINISLNELANDDYNISVIRYDGATCYGKAYSPIYVESVDFDDTELTAYVGTPIQVYAAVSPANASDQSVTYLSSNENYATVDENGIVTVYNAGSGKTVTITATAKDQTLAKDGDAICSTIKIKIIAPITSIKLNKTKATVKAGKSVTLKCNISPKEATYPKITWTSSNKKYATVTKKGVVKTKKAGQGKTVTITASTTDGSQLSVKCKIKIKKIKKKTKKTKKKS